MTDEPQRTPHDLALEQLAAALEQLVCAFEERLLEELAEIEKTRHPASGGGGAGPGGGE